MKELLVTLYAYGRWANQRLLEQAAHLTDAQWRQTFSQGYRPLVDNFAHFVSADWRWYAMGWRGEPAPRGAAPADLTTLDVIRSMWERLYAERHAYLASLTEAQLHEPLRNPRGGPAPLRWQGILTCALHGTQHRSEIAAMLTDCGHSPGDLDLLYFCLEQAQGQAPAAKNIIAALYEHASWANERLLTKAAQLSDTQLRQNFSQGYPSTLDIYAHLFSAERRWLARWRHETPPPYLTVADLPNVEAIRQTWATLYAERHAYIASLNEDELQAIVHFTLRGRPPMELPRWQLLLHVANHAMQHRSEIAAMLTELGQSPGDLDFVFFAMANQ